MINILVTGSDGQLGSELRKLSVEFNQFNFYFTDVSLLDITNVDQLKSFFSENSVQYIINCAAYTMVDKAENDIENANRINVLAVENLLSISKNYNCRLIHISTDYVFDSSGQNFPFKETDQTCSRSVYGMTKLKGEEVLYNSNHSMIIRTSWLYSTFGNNIVKTILRLAQERSELKFIFDQVGTPTYAEDLALTILKIIDLSEFRNSFCSGIFHFSNEGVCSWYDFAVEVIKIAGLQCHIIPIETVEYPLPARRPFYSVLNKSKIKTEFNIKIPHWNESLVKCLKILRS